MLHNAVCYIMQQLHNAVCYIMQHLHNAVCYIMQHLYKIAADISAVYGCYMLPVKTSISEKCEMYFLWSDSPIRSTFHNCRAFEITFRHTRTPLDELSARRRDLYLTTQKNHRRQTAMPPSGFTPAILASVGRRPKIRNVLWGNSKRKWSVMCITK
jgi:hypothetical protein